jgi:putative flippase GtrA
MFNELIKFGVTGGLGTITNLLIFFLLVDRAQLPATAVSVLCFLVAGTQNYVLNHLWSFRKHTVDMPVSVRKWAEFLLGSLLGLFVNILVMNFMLSHFELPYKFIAQACGIAAGMVLNFTISKFLIFKRRKEKNS